MAVAQFDYPATLTLCLARALALESGNESKSKAKTEDFKLSHRVRVSGSSRLRSPERAYNPSGTFISNRGIRTSTGLPSSVTPMYAPSAALSAPIV